MRMGAPERVGCRRDAAASPWKGPLKWDTVESGHWRDSVVSAEESLSESCLHCEINELVRDHIEGQETVVACSYPLLDRLAPDDEGAHLRDRVQKCVIADVTARMAESLVDLILLGPEEARNGNYSLQQSRTSGKRSWESVGRMTSRIRRTDGV
jgi:hypothetical protein